MDAGHASARDVKQACGMDAGHASARDIDQAGSLDAGHTSARDIDQAGDLDTSHIITCDDIPACGFPAQSIVAAQQTDKRKAQTIKVIVISADESQKQVVRYLFGLGLKGGYPLKAHRSIPDRFIIIRCEVVIIGCEVVIT